MVPGWHQAGVRFAGAMAGFGEAGSASGETVVQSDQRRGASETGTIPTARVCHKERMTTPPSTAERFRRAGGGDNTEGDTGDQGAPALAVDTIQDGLFDVQVQPAVGSTWCGRRWFAVTWTHPISLLSRSTLIQC